jgi:hypothetical protein
MTVRADMESLGISGYNGQDFGPTLETTITADPVYSECGRTIIFYICHFHFEWYESTDNPDQPNINDSATTTDLLGESIR